MFAKVSLDKLNGSNDEPTCCLSTAAPSSHLKKHFHIFKYSHTECRIPCSVALTNTIQCKTVNGLCYQIWDTPGKVTKGTKTLIMFLNACSSVHNIRQQQTVNSKSRPYVFVVLCSATGLSHLLKSAIWSWYNKSNTLACGITAAVTGSIPGSWNHKSWA